MTMNNKAPEKKRSSAVRRRRRSGVPAALVAGLLVIALFFGGLMGFAISNKTNSYRRQLEEAQAQIVQLENTLTMMGFSAEESSADEWVFDDTGSMDEFGDLSGYMGSDNSDILWGDGNLLEGLLEYSGDPVVVAEFEGGTLMSDEVIEPYNDLLTTQVFGFYDAGDVSGDALTQVMQQLVTEKICSGYAQQMGLTELSEEDLAKINEEAQAEYEDQKRFYMAYVSQDQTEALDSDEAVEKYLAEEAGITLDGIIAQRKENYWNEKLYNEIVKDVSVSEEELRAEYDALLAEQREQFAQYPEEYEFAVLSGQTIAYNLEGYRRVKHIRISFEDEATAAQAQALSEQIAALDPAAELEQIAQLQEQLDELYATLEGKVQEITEKLEAGADFDELIETYGQDESMKYEPVKSQGCYVSGTSVEQYPSDYVEGCMMLQNVGDVSTPIRTGGSVYIVKYIGDVEAGEVPFDSIRDAIGEELLMLKQEECYVEQVAQWIQDANIKYYPERLQ